MKSITLRRSGDAPLRFDGERIASADGERAGGRERNRWHELVIYRTEAGGYVVAIAFRTRWQGELDHDVALPAADAAAVRDSLLEYDPLSHLVGYPVGGQYAAKQERLEAEMRATYEDLVSRVLDRPEFAVDVAAAVYGPDVRACRHDLCRQLELASLHLIQAGASAICDACNGTMLDESTWQLLWAEIFDADRLNVGEKWSIDAKELAARIRAAGPGAQLALLRDMPASAAGEEEKTQTGLYLGADEIRAVKIAAAEGGTSMGELFRRALWAAGIIQRRNLD